MSDKTAMMGNCKDCEHWLEHEADDPDYGKCVAIKPRDHIVSLTIAIIDGGSTMFTHLATLPNFGCVLFETRGTE